MTQQVVPENTSVTRAERGHWVGSGNPNGRPRKGTTIKDLLRAVPVAQKRALVKVAFEKAIEGDHHWADWIARHSGESATNERESGLMRELIIREYAGWPEQLQ